MIPQHLLEGVDDKLSLIVFCSRFCGVLAAFSSRLQKETW